MYIALGIMICGILVGRLLAGHISLSILRRLVMGAIFLLLFSLGVSIGSNSELLARLPTLGWQALVLMIFSVGGSIAVTVAIKPFLKKIAPRSGKNL